jgi:hypothetical protein
VAVNSGARGAEYELALAWRSNGGLVCKGNRISKADQVAHSVFSGLPGLL